MGMFLNSKIPFEAYKTAASSKYFIDKSKLIEELIPDLGTEERFYCIIRPRRFGKSIMASMIGAFFGKAVKSNQLFEHLNIATYKEYIEHLNQHNVIYIDFSELPRGCNSYTHYINRIQNGVNQDLAESYPDLEIDISDSTWDILTNIFLQKGEKFLFVLDEWDAIFHMPFITENDKKNYLLFLKSLLKNNVYVEFAYMTGILPISKYSSGSDGEDVRPGLRGTDAQNLAEKGWNHRKSEIS